MKTFTLEEIFNIIDKRFNELAKTDTGTPEATTAISQMEALQEAKRDFFNLTYKETA